MKFNQLDVCFFLNESDLNFRLAYHSKDRAMIELTRVVIRNRDGGEMLTIAKTLKLSMVFL